MPGYRSGFPAYRVSSADLGKEVGTLPEGLTTPNSKSVTTCPSSAPWFHASNTAGALSIQGISTGLLSFITTTVVGLMPSS